MRLLSMPLVKPAVCVTVLKSFTALSTFGLRTPVRMHRGIQCHCEAHGRHARARARLREFELYFPNLGNFFTPLRCV
jgi:hypothetical protein